MCDSQVKGRRELGVPWDTEGRGAFCHWLTVLVRPAPREPLALCLPAACGASHPASPQGGHSVDSMMDTNLQKDDLTGTIKFIPPLYKQRYQFIKDLVNKYKPKKVADLGCADCTLLWMLKFCKCIEVLAGLDIRENVMKEKMHRLSPLPADYLQPSERSLTVTLHHGSVAHKDPCMLGFDLVTCIELIEHLEAAELEKFPEVVFGFMAPAMVVISTPNSEFNPLLPGVTLFRHSDHKFEWDRAQFQSWAVAAATRYDYTVEFTGLGTPPPGTEDVGFCTQIGVFVRKYPKNGETLNSEKHTEHAYKTVNVKTETEIQKAYLIDHCIM
ncbi:small RNA 2'-O-methyltransferase isoform X6 [Mauremys reevesii]|uniref:small RNA 2'-O-methyltransferase isoform X6 n=1 Tax=Mauremys reevesii TaxID=260615 RepID=UPI00193EF4B4|nr:small RNA 2'-O-methyltransferase isoform X6 [Mauremys reevesii]